MTNVRPRNSRAHWMREFSTALHKLRPDLTGRMWLGTSVVFYNNGVDPEEAAQRMAQGLPREEQHAD